MKKTVLHCIAILMALCLVISCDSAPEVKTFKVTFDSDGGTEIAAVEVAEGEKVTAPETPAKTCWTFDEWQLDGKAFDFEAPIKSDLTLKATWKATDAVWNGEAADTKWYDEHTEDETYTITTAAQLAGLAELVNRADSPVNFAKKRSLLLLILISITNPGSRSGTQLPPPMDSMEHLMGMAIRSKT